MAHLHTETIIRHFPGMALTAMENGGMIFTEEGELVDAIDQPNLTRDRVSIDTMNGDGDKGRFALTSHDEEESPETQSEELLRLIKEQTKDDADTKYIKTASERETEDDDSYDYDGTDITPTHFDDRNSCNSEYPGHRTNGKGGWMRRNYGQKPEYKDRRLRAAGSSKTRAKN